MSPRYGPKNTFALARNAAFGDDDLADAWRSYGRRDPLIAANSITLTLTTVRGRTLKTALRYAVLERGAGTGEHTVVATPAATPDMCLAAMEDVCAWYDSDGESWTTQRDAFRSATLAFLRERILPPARLGAEGVAEAVERLVATGQGRDLTSFEVAFGCAGTAEVVARTRDGRIWTSRLPRRRARKP